VVTKDIDVAIDLLQQAGLNKYEAEAYHALLRYGAMTGYELGKRSGVPLSRSYEVLERLVERGMALVQPGDPPRYAAEAPEQFVARTRAAATRTLDALAAALTETARPRASGDFWVLRGRAAILARAQTIVASTIRDVALSSALLATPDLEDALANARARGCRVVEAAIGPAAALLVADEREALSGTFDPADTCQAVVSTNSGFVAALTRAVTPRMVVLPAQRAEAATRGEVRPLDWLDWEERKQRGLLGGR
jgi:HTH-type transcriptional regulator, sugar sensing transcriptional regulator